MNIIGAVRIVLLAVLLTLPAISSADELTIVGLVFGKPLELDDCAYRVIAGSKNYTYPAPKTCVQDPHTINGYGHPSRRIIFSNEECPIIVKNCQIAEREERARPRCH